MTIDIIRDSVKSGVTVEYSAHCQKRMFERAISRRDILNCILTGEIIEEYRLDQTNLSEKSLPSYLILGFRNFDKQAIHIVVGFNGQRLLIISACYPDDTVWLSNYKTRRSKNV